MKKRNPQSKKAISISIQALIMILILAFTFLGTSSFAQKNATTMKIGVYDSRNVVFAYSRSALFTEHIQRFGKQSNSAIKARDTVKVRELSIRAMSYQHLLHLMVFGSGSITSVTEFIKASMPELAKKAGVSIIVSKFELNYKDPSIEVVDLTNDICQLFNHLKTLQKWRQKS